MAKIYNPEGKLLQAYEIADWANRVHRRSGGKSNAFFALDFVQGYGDRLKGHHCGCGVDPNGYSKGEFTLLPLNDQAVIEGGKAYMVCKICGQYSHL